MNGDRFDGDSQPLCEHGDPPRAPAGGPDIFCGRRHELVLAIAAGDGITPELAELRVTAFSTILGNDPKPDRPPVNADNRLK